ncbi:MULTISPECIES: hypothetical protein [unclassified Yoonia]|uniref:hypothetical protein n=1 Tax=unclassified Yoonia TaxID=2629118 RepID=UPI002AFFCAD5|nr:MULTISPECIES: hypothetical protein [unclassified Yoonia]
MKNLKSNRVDAIAMMVCFFVIPAIVFIPLWGLLTEMVFAELLYIIVFGFQMFCVAKLQPLVAKKITQFLTDGEDQ